VEEGLTGSGREREGGKEMRDRGERKIKRGNLEVGKGSKGR